MSSYSDFVGYVPDKLRLQLSGTVTGEGIVPANNLGLPNDFFVSTAQGVSTTSRGVSNPGVCLNGTNSTFNIESGVNYISFQNIVAANGNLTITGESGGVAISSVTFPKLEYTAGSISGLSPRVSGYSLQALKAAEGNIFFSGVANQQINFSGLRRAKGIFLEYGTGGTLNGLNTLDNFIACVPTATITGISGSFLNYPFTGVVKITGDVYPIAENSITVTPSGQPVFTTASGTISGNILTGLKQGSVFYYPPNNSTNIVLAPNFINPVPSSAPAVLQVTATTGLTGITFPPVSGSVYFQTWLNSGSAAGTALNINILATGHSGTFLGFSHYPRSTAAAQLRRVNITISGYSAASGNSGGVVTGVTQPGGPIIGNMSGAIHIVNQSPSGTFISGNNLTRFFSTASNFTGNPAAYFVTTNGPLTYTATGTELLYGTGATQFVGTSGFFAIGNTNSTGTFNFLNATYVSGFDNLNGQYTLQAVGNASRVIFNLPVATRLHSAISGSAAASGSAVILDAPQLSTGDGNGTIYLTATTTGAFATGILSNPASGASGITAITGFATNGGRVSISTTGGTPFVSGTIANVGLITTGNGTGIFDFGGTQSITILTLLNQSGVSAALTGTATGLINPNTINATLTGGSCVFTCSEIATGSTHTLRVVGLSTSTSGIFNFTGGIARSGILRGDLSLTTLATGAIAANYGSLQTITGNLVFNASDVSTASLTATGLNVISGNVFTTGTTQANVFYTGGQISGYSGVLRIINNLTGNINYFCTGGTSFANSSIASGVFVSSNTNATTTLNLGGLFNTAGLYVTGATGTTISITATGLSSFSGISFVAPTGTGCVTFGSTGGNIFYTGAQISGMSGSLTGIVNTSGTINFAFTGGTPFANSSINSGIDLRATGTGVPGTSAITGNLGGVVNSSGVNIISAGSGAVVSLTATGLSNLTGSVTISSITGGVVLYTGGVQNSPGGVSLTTIGSGASINCIFTGPAATGVIGTISITGANADTFITGTFNNSANINTTTISTSGRVVITATGVTGADAINITGLTTSSFVTGSFSNLQRVTGSLAIQYSGSGGINIGNIQGIGGSFIISGGTAAGTFPINGRSDLSGINSLTGISTATFSTTVPGFFITGLANTFSGSVLMTGLRQIGTDLSSTGALTLNNNFVSRIEATGIRSFELPNLTGWYGSINLSLPNATGFNLSSVKFIGGNGATTQQASVITGLIFTLGSSITGAITMTGLQYIYVRDGDTSASQSLGTPFIFRASGATSISIPNIITGFLRQTPSGNFTNTGTFSGASITGLSFGSSGITKELFMSFTASGCPLNQASVDDILKTFASLDGTAGTTVYSGLTIRLNGLCAAPSAAGAGYRTTLTGAGRLNTVLVN